MYGALLSLTHVWTFLYWNRSNAFSRILSHSNTSQLCFPFFPDCGSLRFFDAEILKVILFIYLALALINFNLFLVKGRTRHAYFLFAFLFFAKLFFYIQHYGFMGNYHYMANITILAFLFLPRKKEIAKLLIVGFYLAAGFLKINLEWLSGAAMIRRPILVGDTLVASLYYVVFLELFFSFGLLSKKNWLRWLCLGQFVAFHIFSWHIVGFFYPCMMASLLSIFFIDEYLARNKTDFIPDLNQKFIGGGLLRVHYITLGFFLIMQLFPHFFVSTPSLSGSLRVPSLNMFDANSRCKTMFIVEKNGLSAQIRKDQMKLGTRIQCDPIVYISQIRSLCQKNSKTKDFEKLTFSLVSKRLTDKNYQPVLFFSDACAEASLYLAEFYKWGKFYE